MTRHDARLLALDWGTSSLRAFLLDADGQVLQQRAAARGIGQLAEPGPAGFEQALAEIAGDWLRERPGLPVVAGGMVGSAQGWREAPYVPCPADVNRLAASAASVHSELAGNVLLAPGLVCAAAAGDGLPDVMRGEEIQIAGALHGRPDWARACHVVLPGTHGKWAQVRAGAVLGFRTYMTGELFALLCRHSLLGRLMPADGSTGEPADHAAGFTLGLEQAGRSAPGDLAHQIFATRTLGLQLDRQLAPHALADYLSGLLIGHEVVSGLAHLRALDDAPGTLPLLLVGDAELCTRYARALTHFGHPATAQTGNTAPLGLYHFALAAGLLGAPR
ncbi:2-dehydro-3-deoxygalactonokinase [Pseudorhodoferax sp. Leaf267]|uniref:2-dehydro-3-deoxygalactonokinase n=1 Tax=Pseudorhodoferax sp. Leaf267 TaxID=1736316 RepID=UPI000700A21C|nr:2-dehydro-3-deoxygalactonokinase [Pseudorhodoferax sp. Leaf267]KQP17759.1 2-keto-3-deoxy-galactonokinase [Pseudorhodoferax sp. Leaf267]